jgi:hypothetical protein
MNSQGRLSRQMHPLRRLSSLEAHIFNSYGAAVAVRITQRLVGRGAGAGAGAGGSGRIRPRRSQKRGSARAQAEFGVAVAEPPLQASPK